MKELKGTKTEKNLWEAFAGESQARNKYTYFASVAKKAGYEQLAAIFLETADQEKEHAKMWFKEFHGLGDTAQNLKWAAEGENEEWWRVNFTPEKSGLYWYNFSVSRCDGESVITRFEGGKGRISPDGTSFQLTVYSKNFSTPDWIKGSVIYQIFPDRFFASGTPKKNVPEDLSLIHI